MSRFPQSIRWALLALVPACGSPTSPVANAAHRPETSPAPVYAVWQPGTPCVDAPADALARLADHFGMKPDMRETFGAQLAPSARPDLDGDGTPDAIFADSPGEVPLSLVYVSRGTCSHLLAEVVGEVEVRAERTNGWPDLRVTDHGPEEAQGPGTPPRVTTLKFDGTSYQPSP